MKACLKDSFLVSAINSTNMNSFVQLWDELYDDDASMGDFVQHI